MKSNDIIIHFGKTITNNPEFTLDNGSTNKTDINYLRVRPSRNYEIEQNSIRLIELKTCNYPIALLMHFLFTPFYIFKEDGQPQLATLNKKGEFEYSLENKTNILYTEETANLSWGFAVPIASLNSLSECRSIGEIYPKDLLEYSSFNNQWFWHTQY